jgi:hypothetical protein
VKRNLEVEQFECRKNGRNELCNPIPGAKLLERGGQGSKAGL